MFNNPAELDKKWMRAALSLARRGLGQTAPNPSVGCLLVKNNRVIGRGWTQPGGRPHAEAMALVQAGNNAAGATAYVTLEPCAHHGKTPPCAEALVKAKVSRVVVALTDSDERVAGRGIGILKAAGIAVELGVLQEDAARLNRGFFCSINEDRPEFTLKIASSIDGKIALANGQSKWITGTEARQYGHMLRATHDAILVGSNTVEIDNPNLDCRLDGLEKKSPIPIVLSNLFNVSVESSLVRSCTRSPLMVIGSQLNENSRALEEKGVDVCLCDDVKDLKAVSSLLVSKGIRRVLVEGGAAIHAAFLQSGFCDSLYHFSAGKLLGADSKSGIGNLNLAELTKSPHLKRMKSIPIGNDLLSVYEKPE